MWLITLHISLYAGRDRSLVVPETPLGDVSLTLPKHGYRQLAHDDLLHMLLPQVKNLNFLVKM